MRFRQILSLFLAISIAFPQGIFAGATPFDHRIFDPPTLALKCQALSLSAGSIRIGGRLTRAALEWMKPFSKAPNPTITKTPLAPLVYPGAIDPAWKLPISNEAGYLVFGVPTGERFIQKYVGHPERAIRSRLLYEVAAAAGVSGVNQVQMRWVNGTMASWEAYFPGTLLLADDTQDTLLDAFKWPREDNDGSAGRYAAAADFYGPSLVAADVLGLFGLSMADSGPEQMMIGGETHSEIRVVDYGGAFASLEDSSVDEEREIEVYMHRRRETLLKYGRAVLDAFAHLPTSKILELSNSLLPDGPYKSLVDRGLVAPEQLVAIRQNFLRQTAARQRVFKKFLSENDTSHPTPLKAVPTWISPKSEGQILKLWEAFGTPLEAALTQSLSRHPEVVLIRQVNSREIFRSISRSQREELVEQWVSKIVAELDSAHRSFHNPFRRSVFSVFAFILLENVVQHVLSEGHRATLVVARLPGGERSDGPLWIYVMDSGPGMDLFRYFRDRKPGAGTDRGTALQALQSRASTTSVPTVFWSGHEFYSVDQGTFHSAPLSPPGTLAAVYVPVDFLARVSLRPMAAFAALLAVPFLSGFAGGSMPEWFWLALGTLPWFLLPRLQEPLRAGVRALLPSRPEYSLNPFRNNIASDFPGHMSSSEMPTPQNHALHEIVKEILQSLLLDLFHGDASRVKMVETGSTARGTAHTPWPDLDISLLFATPNDREEFWKSIHGSLRSAMGDALMTRGYLLKAAVPGRRDNPGTLWTLTIEDPNRPRKHLVQITLQDGIRRRLLSDHTDSQIRQWVQLGGTIDHFRREVILLKRLLDHVLGTYTRKQGGPTGIAVEQLILQSGGTKKGSDGRILTGIGSFDRAMRWIVEASFKPTGEFRREKGALKRANLKSPVRGGRLLDFMTEAAWVRLARAARKYVDRGKTSITFEELDSLGTSPVELLPRWDVASLIHVETALPLEQVTAWSERTFPGDRVEVVPMAPNEFVIFTGRPVGMVKGQALAFAIKGRLIGEILQRRNGFKSPRSNGLAAAA